MFKLYHTFIKFLIIILTEAKYRSSDKRILSDSNTNLKSIKIAKWKDFMYYFGELNANNQREGLGFGVYWVGTIYHGFWKDGDNTGQGLYIDTEGNVFFGKWKDCSLNGYGGCIKRSGIKKKGWWKDGKLDGKGFEIIPNQSTYRGEYEP